MRPRWIIGNWKMNGSMQANVQLLSSLSKELVISTKVNCAVCPPLVYLQQVAQQLQGMSIRLGAQNVCAQSADIGAYTGEVSAQMLADCSASLVLIGHSERRAYYHENDEILLAKINHALACNLTPVLCVGESLEQREQGEALSVITQQVAAIVDALGVSASKKLIIAYEPVWAIGTGLTASPEQAQEVHGHIRALLQTYDMALAQDVAILYGGSVNAANAQALFAMQDIDGALIGGASLKAEEFSAIYRFAEK